MESLVFKQHFLKVNVEVYFYFRSFNFMEMDQLDGYSAFR